MRLLTVFSPFLRHFRPHWPRLLLGTLAAAAAMTAAVGLLALAGWFLAAAAIAGLGAGTARAFNIALPSVGIRLFAFTRIAARYAERLLAHDATFRILKTLRVRFYEALEPLAPACLLPYRSGDILSRLVSDIDALDNLYVRIVSPAVSALVIIAGLVGFLGLFDALLAAAAGGILTAAAAAVPWAASAAAMEPGRRLAEESAELRAGIIEGLQGVTELIVFGALPRHLEECRGRHLRLLRLQQRVSRVRGLSSAGITALAGSAVGVVLLIGIGLVESGALAGEFLACLVLAVWTAFEAAAPLSHAFQQLGRTRQAAERIYAITSLAPAVRFPETAPDPPDGFDVAFEKIRFAYPPGGVPALEGVDLLLAQGRRTALVGETGCGKSTLVHLLARHWDPDEGCIRIGGRDVREFTQAQLRRTMTVISQQAHIFNATLAANLRIAAPAAEEAALWHALEAVHLAGLVRSLPEGLDTWVGEGGRRLSGGEARRLALARAVLHDAPVWVLDEPTEGLDKITEAAVIQGLLEHAGKRTLLIITHRLIDFHRLDQVAFMEKGRIEAVGSHAELIRTDGGYLRLFRRMA